MTDNNNDEPDFRELYKRLLHDENFDKLEAELRKPNIFSILGIGRAEIRHSNFLAWLLDPNESHGLGNRFLIRILRDFAVMENELDIFEINKLNFNSITIDREVPAYNNETKKYDYIDLLIVFKDEEDKNKLVICIENKIDTTDFDGQLKKYEKYVGAIFRECQKKIFVYLTPFGDSPTNHDGTSWHTYSYEEIITHLNSVQKETINSTIKVYISDYLSTLKNKIMGKNDSATDLASKIYEQHSKIFDFVNDNMSKEIITAIWDNENKWLKNSVEKLINEIKKIDSKAKYELGFTKTYISIKCDNQKIYAFYPNKEPKYSLEFSFTKKENKQDVIESIDKLLRDSEVDESKWNDGVYFIINSFEEILNENPTIFQDIHKERFQIK